MKTFYYDYAATTPVDSRVAVKMNDFLTSAGSFGNPASQHSFGQAAKIAIEKARQQVADYLSAEASEILWTSGATESINLALKGSAKLNRRKGNHIITMKTEHKAVLDTCQHLEKDGYQVSYLSPQPNGLLDLNLLQETLREDTILVSIMHVNNETGIIQDIDAIAALTSQKGILFHVDAAQSPGKIALDVTKTPIDLVSLNAHKVYGPKGIGALYLRKKPRVRVEPLIHGGGHEQGMRSGTLATHQIVGMGEAFEIAQQEWQQDYERIKQWRNYFIKNMQHPKVILNVGDRCAVPHILNIRFDGMISDAILADLPQIAASTASACQGKGTEGSYVLRALGLNAEQVKSSLRFSFGRFTTHEEVEFLVSLLKNYLAGGKNATPNLMGSR